MILVFPQWHPAPISALRKRRLELGLSQTDRCERIGGRRNTTSWWESYQVLPDHRNMPNVIEFIAFNPQTGQHHQRFGAKALDQQQIERAVVAGQQHGAKAKLQRRAADPARRALGDHMIAHRLGQQPGAIGGFVSDWSEKIGIPANRFVGWLGIAKSNFTTGATATASTNASDRAGRCRSMTPGV